MWTSIVYLTLIALLWYSIASVLAWYPLRKFQGPFLASFSYLWLFHANYKGDRWRRVHELQQKLTESSASGKGSLLRIGPNLLITDHPDILRRMSTVRSTYTRGGWYDAVRLHPDNPSMFGSRDTAWHDDVKARTAAGYSGREIPNLEQDVNDIITQLKTYIREKYVSKNKKGTQGKLLDFTNTSGYFALDVISKIAFGNEFGFLAAGADVNGYLAALDIFAPALSLFADIPWMRAILANRWVFETFGPKATDEKGPGRIMGLAKRAVDERFEAKGGFRDLEDMLGSFLRHGITRYQCEAEGVLQITAGSDTTSNVIRATMLYLATTPTAYRRLQQEVDEAVKSGKASSPIITSAEAKALPYLQAVLLEGLRIHPPTLILASKQVPPEGDTIEGKFIPGGTEIAQNSWTMLRNKQIFGQDADLFRPERWLEESDAETKAEMERTAGLMFGHGRWMCAGKSIAMMELGKLFFELFREFDFQVADPTRPWEMKQFSIFMFKGLLMRVTEREEAWKG
ncbi:cytochrome P450 [Rhypophila decipiens]